MLALALAATLLFPAQSPPPPSADLRFVCDVVETHTDGREFKLGIRYDLTIKSKSVIEYHNTGNGFRFHREHPYVSLDEKAFVSLNDAVEFEEINRQTSRLYFKHKSSGVVQEGKCAESKGEGDYVS